MSYPYIIQGNNVTVVIGNKPYTISNTHISYNKVIDAIKADDWETVQNVIEPKKVVLDYGQGRVSIKGETLYWDNEVFNGSLAVRMINMLQEGFSIEPLVKFMENLLENPSKRAVDELYGFLEKNNLPITPDGYFLAYKRVRNDYKDCHTGTMDNSVGQVVSMPRYKVDDDKDKTCSTGLHFCSEGYLKHFGGARTVIVKINPCDVVSIPSDYDNTKGRACKYEVIGEIGNTDTPTDEFTKPVQNNANSVDTQPKTNNTSFYKGYSDGYNDLNNTSGQYSSYNDVKNYKEGFDKGTMARFNNQMPKYIYKDKNQIWPFPKTNP